MGEHTSEEVIDRPFADFVGKEEATRLSESYRRWMRGEEVP